FFFGLCARRGYVDELRLSAPKYRGQVRSTARRSRTPAQVQGAPLEPEMLEELKKQVAKQLELGVIRPSKSEWAVAPHFVKKTGEWRCVTDYRRSGHGRRLLPPSSHPGPPATGGRTEILLHFITPIGPFEFNVIPSGI
ncbi:hypothetical protein GNI_022550, partial [Gregarina niphandrodes]